MLLNLSNPSNFSKNIVTKVSEIWHELVEMVDSSVFKAIIQSNPEDYIRGFARI